MGKSQKRGTVEIGVQKEAKVMKIMEDIDTAEQNMANMEKDTKEDMNSLKLKKQKKKQYIIPGIFITLFVFATAMYFTYNKITGYYLTHFFPNTTINGIECGNMEVEKVIDLLESWIDGYVLEVTGRDYKTGNAGAVLGRIESSDIQLAFTGTQEAVTFFLGQQEANKWILMDKDQEISYSLEQGIIFDEDMLTATVKEWEACRVENMLKAQDAYISEHSEGKNSYEIIAETVSTELDVDKVIQLVKDAVMERKTTLDIEGQGCYREASILRDSKTLTDALDTLEQWMGACVTYNWNGTEVKLDQEILKDWISVEGNKPALDEDAVAQFVKNQAAMYDTYGKWRNFKTALGVELTLPSGYYGWKTDTESETQELIQLIYQGSITQKEPIYSSTAQKKGMDDIGNSYVEADLTHQHLYLYHKGNLVLETDFVSGDMNSKPGNVTPEGVFGVSYKTTNAILRGEDYRTPVSYWMPYYGNYGMHDATWRSEFGGNIYMTNGSHGCINLPLDKAAQIYAYVYAGFPVVCYYYQVDPLAGQNKEDTEPKEDEPETEDWDESETEDQDEPETEDWDESETEDWDESETEDQDESETEDQDESETEDQDEALR